MHSCTSGALASILYAYSGWAAPDLNRIPIQHQVTSFIRDGKVLVKSWSGRGDSGERSIGVLHHSRRQELRQIFSRRESLELKVLEGARTFISKLVGRDTDRMDIAACRRAAIESLSENLTDGFVSPLCWYVVAGLPGLVLFRVVSTMDSMVGYKTPRYLKFGWCGARLDDLMNFVPARITWLLLTFFSFVLPGCSGRKAFSVGWQQHAILPGPNSGWSEAATAGGIQRKLLGPIWAEGSLVTDVWLGDPSDPPAGGGSDLPRAAILNVAAGVLAAALAVLLATQRI